MKLSTPSFVLGIVWVLWSSTSYADTAAKAKQSKTIESQTIDYSKLAFYPDRWKKANVDTSMLAWEGEHVVLVTRKGQYDATRMKHFVERLDGGWKIYADLIGRAPSAKNRFNGKPTICAIPNSNLSCGYGCGYVGATGIEASAFYNSDWPAFQRDPSSFRHYYFYEMGRNYYVFGKRHSLFITGYAVFMRYVCMDNLRCRDVEFKTRQTIESCEAIYAQSNLDFLSTFTNLGDGEKSNRLKDRNGRTIAPSDQPVMYATAMLKLRKHYGGDRFVGRFYQTMLKCPRVNPTNREAALKQCHSWLVSASASAGQDLSPIFADRWRMPLSRPQRRLMAKADWSEVLQSPSELITALQDAGEAASGEPPHDPRERDQTPIDPGKQGFGFAG